MNEQGGAGGSPKCEYVNIQMRGTKGTEGETQQDLESRAPSYDARALRRRVSLRIEGLGAVRGTARSPGLEPYQSIMDAILLPH
jgi:hypothetical protein